MTIALGIAYIIFGIAFLAANIDLGDDDGGIMRAVLTFAVSIMATGASLASVIGGLLVSMGHASAFVVGMILVGALVLTVLNYAIRLVEIRLG